MKPEERDPLSEAVIGAAIEVHRLLGPGLLESMYQKAMCHELALRGIPFRPQAAVEVEYKGCILGDDLKIDLLVDGALVVEIKSVESLDAVHEAQLMTYLKLTNIYRGLLINFNSKLVKDGIRRRVLGEPPPNLKERPSWLRE